MMLTCVFLAQGAAYAVASWCFARKRDGGPALLCGVLCFNSLLCALGVWLDTVGWLKP